MQTATLVRRCQHRCGEGITVTDDWARERDASRPVLGSHKSAGGTAGLAGRRSRVCSRPAAAISRPPLCQVSPLQVVTEKEKRWKKRRGFFLFQKRKEKERTRLMSEFTLVIDEMRNLVELWQAGRRMFCTALLRCHACPHRSAKVTWLDWLISLISQRAR